MPQGPEPSRTHDADARMPLALRLARGVSQYGVAEVAPAAAAKARACLLDFVGCALEARSLPPSRQAQAVATPATPGASVIGMAGGFGLADAAFANAVMGHGLVREDMHSASISHLGVAVLPALLALTHHRRVDGAALVAAIVAGYEVGAQIGAALMDARLARIFRPTGITGPLAAAAAGARLLGLDATRSAHAIALAANTTAGFNQWGHTGGSEMYFHPGFAARNAVTSVLLAEAGAFASPSALDGEAGLFAAFGKREAAAGVVLFEGEPQILAVYHKPVPACNFAQTPSQAALALARSGNCPADQIERITVRVPQAGASYPGCDFRGPFEHALQAKMSIQYNVAAALLTGDVTEANFAMLRDEQLHALLARTWLEADEALTQAYPREQGGEVEVLLRDGSRHSQRLPDVVHASQAQVRARFRSAAVQALGAAAAQLIEQCVDGLDASTDARLLSQALRKSHPEAGGNPMSHDVPALAVAKERP